MQSSRYIWQSKDWPRFRWDSSAILTSLGDCRIAQGKLISSVRALGLESQAEILVEEVQKTAAIEGERLDVSAVRSSVSRRLGLPSAGLPVDRNIDGLVDLLLDATHRCDEPLTEERLFGWQAALFPTGYSGLHKVRVGSWRGPAPMRVVSGPVGRETVHFEAPPAEEVQASMSTFFDWWQSSSGSVEGVVRAALAHIWFVTIHPFEDGNGRLARAITDMALAQDDNQPFRYYSLSSQIMAERDDYYAVLESCQKGGLDITLWILWFLDCFGRSIERSEVLLKNVLLKASFWQVHAEETISERQRKVLNKLLDVGPGGFEGGLTTRKYASMAKVSKATAFREIRELLERGFIIQNPGGGRSVSYDILWPE